MTEAEWLACQSASHLFSALQGKELPRKRRLFGCACCRRHWTTLTNWPALTVAVETAEAWADNATTSARVQQAFAAAEAVWESARGDEPNARRQRSAARAAKIGLSLCPAWIFSDLEDLVSPGIVRSINSTAPAPVADEGSAHTKIARDIFGNPFRPIALVPAWRTATVISLAQAIYDGRHFDRLPILADALEDAGCTDAAILDHCRQPGEHARGCWVVDLVLGKS